MRATVVVLFFILSAFTVQAGYVEVDLLEKTDTGFVSLGGRGGFGFVDRKESSGIFFKTKNAIGVATSMIDNNKDLIYEIIYDISINKTEDEFYINGVIYNHHFTNDTIIANGVKKYFMKKMSWNNPVQIPIGQSHKNIDLALKINILEKKPESTVDKGGAFAKRVVYFDGNVVSESTSGLGRLKKSNKFRDRGSRQNPKTGKLEMFKYFSEIQIDDLPDNISGPFTAVVKYLRTYEIDEDHKPNLEFNKTASYMSVYSESIRFTPGETVMLIFPPDEPSVGEWGVVDTLYLKVE